MPVKNYAITLIILVFFILIGLKFMKLITQPPCIKPMSYAILLFLINPVSAEEINTEKPISKENKKVTSSTSTTVLEDVLVTADKIKESVNTTNATNTTSKDIKENQINSQKDLVRYNPEVSVSEVGRYGSKGFAIRGVEGNRVAVTVDDLAIPDIEVNELFTPYGYINNSRFSSDIELMENIQIKHGSDGVSSGSGSLGGSVGYKTKEPEDLFNGKKIGKTSIGGYAKSGYTTKNEEGMFAVGLSAKTAKFSGIVNYVERDGHELKNHKMRKFDKKRLSINYVFPENEVGTKGIYPDPSHYVSNAILAKVNFEPNEQHKLGFNTSFDERENQNYAITKHTFGSQRRLAWDKNQRSSHGVSYEYTPLDNKVIDTVEAKYQHQSVMALGNTYTYYEDFVDEGVYELAFNEYRPIYQDTDKVSLSTDFQTKDFPLFSVKTSHDVSLETSFSRGDYDPYYVTYSTFGNFMTIASPDMKTDIFSAAISDDIKVGEKNRISAGMRYDKYTRKPYFHAEKEADIARYSGGILKEMYDNGDFDKHTTFDNIGWSFLAERQLSSEWTGEYKVATGFLVPTINQMYSSFCFLGNCQKPNTDLSPETSVNHELAAKGEFDKGNVEIRGYYSKYKNFIDTINYNGQLPNGTYSNLIEAINIDDADVKGISVGGGIYLDTLLNIDSGASFTLNGRLSYAKDSTSKGTNLLATQPSTGIIGLDYTSPSEKYNLHGKLTYIAKKKASDTKKLEYDYENQREYVDSFIKTEGLDDKLSSALLLDFYGNVKLSKNLSLNAGVYNLLDEKYIPWDSVRQLSVIGINNMVRGDGIWRYSAPGRNYGISVNYKF